MAHTSRIIDHDDAYMSSRRRVDISALWEIGWRIIIFWSLHTKLVLGSDEWCATSCPTTLHIMTKIWFRSISCVSHSCHKTDHGLQPDGYALLSAKTPVVESLK